MLTPFKNNHACSYFVISQFQNHNYQNKTVDMYVQDMFKYYFEYFRKGSYEYAFGLAYKTSKQIFIEEFRQDMFLLLAVSAHLKIKKEISLYDIFMENFKVVFNVHGIFTNYTQGLITDSEFFHQVHDTFVLIHRKKPQAIKELVAKYKSYLPTGAFGICPPFQAIVTVLVVKT